MHLLRRSLLSALFAAGLGVSNAGPAWAGQLADARRHIEREDYRRAIDVLAEYTQKFPNEPRGWALLADCYQGIFPPRVSDAEDALNRKAAAENKRSAIYQSFQKLEASALYQKMIKDDPEDPVANLLLAIALVVNDRDGNRAKVQLERFLELGGASADLADAALGAQGLVYTATKQWDEARLAYERLKQRTGSTFAMVKLREVSRLEAEDRDARYAAANDPARVAERRYLQLIEGAKGLIAEGNSSGAVDLLEEAVKLRPEGKEAPPLLDEARIQGAKEMFAKGKQLTDDSKYAQAYGCFERAIQLDPTNEDAVLGLKHVQKSLSELEGPKVVRRIISATESVEASASVPPSPSVVVTPPAKPPAKGPAKPAGK
ncbi:MAG: tetratricopeptide repeat protein [Candidatus Sericytochromatia bacterium]|nr:tetratricopeptide repeat protein [Candidatus Sericytochromatia bacterium]